VFFEYGPLHLAAHANIVTASSQWQRVEISLEPGLTLLSWPRGDTVDQPSLVNPVVGPMLRLTASYLSDETEDSEPMAVGFYVGNMSYLAQGMAIRLDLSWPLIGGDSYAPLFSFGIMWTRRGN